MAETVAVYEGLPYDVTIWSSHGRVRVDCDYRLLKLARWQALIVLMPIGNNEPSPLHPLVSSSVM